MAVQVISIESILKKAKVFPRKYFQESESSSKMKRWGVCVCVNGAIVSIGGCPRARRCWFTVFQPRHTNQLTFFSIFYFLFSKTNQTTPFPFFSRLFTVKKYAFVPFINMIILKNKSSWQKVPAHLHWHWRRRRWWGWVWWGNWLVWCSSGLSL